MSPKQMEMVETLWNTRAEFHGLTDGTREYLEARAHFFAGALAVSGAALSCSAYNAVLDRWEEMGQP
jgi:hypothetical protein